MSPDQIGVWAGFILTLMVFSYILADNFLYRLAIYVFTGLTAGFVAVVTWDSVINPWVQVTIQSDTLITTIIGAIPLVLGLLLLLKPIRGLGAPGTLVIAFIVGIGAAVAVLGAVSGTLIPLTVETGESLGDSLLVGGFTILGVVTTLVHFQYGVQRKQDGSTQRGILTRLLSGIGAAFIAITFGTLYAAAIVTSLTVFTERVSFILTQIIQGSG